MVDRLSFEAGAKEITLTLDGTATVLTAHAGEKGLDSILTNVIGNAIKYTPAGGRVRVGVSRDGAQALITVSDTGVGIPAGDLARIGEEFYRAGNVRRSDVAGTGLGLSIVRELVSRFGGALDIASVEGEGTTVSVRLPLVEDVS